MAKPQAAKTPSTDVAVIDPPTNALSVMDQDLLDDAGQGTENVRPEDVRPPRLTLCQDGTPQRKKGNAKYLEGLQEGVYFNSLSGEFYGPSVKIVVIQKLKTNYMQFAHGELGKVLDYDVPANDARTMPTKDADGKYVKPIATQFDNYLVLLPDYGEVMTFSFKSTALAAARQLDSFIKYPMKIGAQILTKPPAWARTYVLTTGPKSGHGNTWLIPKVSLVGPTSPDMRGAAKSLFDQYSKVTVVVEHDEAVSDKPDDETIPF